MSPPEAILFIQELLIKGIKALSESGNFTSIKIPCLPGNHGRTTKRKRYTTGYKNSYEWLMYHHIAKIFEAGQASTLKEAYDKAVYLNPTTRQKELERLATEKAQALASEQQARQTKIARSTAADLSLDPKSRNGTVPVGSLDDTLAETMARIEGRA
jgi:hypothetical protein